MLADRPTYFKGNCLPILTMLMKGFPIKEYAKFDGKNEGYACKKRLWTLVIYSGQSSVLVDDINSLIKDIHG